MASTGKFAALVIGVLMVVACVLWIVVASQPSWSSKAQSMGDFPIVLEPDDMFESESVGRLSLRPDGEAELIGFPVGSVKMKDGSLCLDWDGSLTYTGPARWSADDRLMLTISTEAGDSLIGPYSPPFSDVVWYKLGVPRCAGGDPLWYWSAAE